MVILDISTADVSAFVHQIPTKSLSDQSYIVVVGNEAVAIDIQRDLDRFEGVLAEVDVPLVAVFETHIHNDYVSGGRRFADLHDAAYVLPANSDAQYRHDRIADGETIEVGGWVVRAMHTPGHTFNHMSYVLESPDGSVAIFSGGSMLVGAVGRSDLLGPDHTKELLASQFASVNRIANELPDPSLVAPTHGAGSFCASGGSADSTSTISQEKLRNPALLAPSVEVFSMAQSMSMKMYPSYYRHMAHANLDTIDDPPTADLSVLTSVEDVEDATIVDIRPFAEYASGHIPGSLSFEVSNDAAVYIGWTLEWDSSLVLVGSVEHTETIRTHLVRIGWDNIVGRIRPEDVARFASGGLATIRTIDFRELSDMMPLPVLDVRDPLEYESGVVPGADLVHLSGVAARPELFADDGPVVVHCASGYRASIAASFIAAAGGSPIVVVDSIANFEGTMAKPAV